jgi:hypothetical protein
MYPNLDASSAISWVLFTKKGAFENIPPRVRLAQTGEIHNCTPKRTVINTICNPAET